jgi:outer membrane protein TolC
LQLALKKAQRQAQLGQWQYKKGAISYLDFLNYQENVDVLQIEATQYKQQYLNSVVGLYQALGSGSRLKMCSNPNHKPNPDTIQKFTIFN